MARIESGLNVLSVKVFSCFILHTDIYFCLWIWLPSENNHQGQNKCDPYRFCLYGLDNSTFAPIQCLTPDQN
ncbi:hypothetical protein Hanom_Chr09g00805321 [Helianthus anomalus]